MKKLLSFFLVVIFCFPFAALFAQKTSVIDSLQTVMQAAQEDTGRVNMLNSLSMQSINNSDYDKAIQYADSALTLAGRLNFEKGKSKAYVHKGLTNKNKGNYEEALRNNQLALSISEKLADKDGIAASNNNMGVIYKELGNYPKALKHHQLAIEIGKEAGDKDLLAEGYLLISGVYRLQGNYPEAMKNTLASLKLNEEMGDKRGIANCLGSMGILATIQKNYEDALKYNLAALKLKEEMGDKRDISTSYNNIGLIYEEQGSYAEALKNHLASLKLKEEIGDKRGLATSYHNIGGVYREQGNYIEALKNYKIALGYGEDIGNKAVVANCCLVIGKTLHRQVASEDTLHAKQKYDEAVQYFNRGLAISQALGNKAQIRNCYKAMAETDSARADFVQAFEHYKLYTLYKDSLTNEESNKQTAQLKIQFESEKKDKEIELLNKENKLKALQVEQQNAALLASQLEFEKKQNQILLLNATAEVQELQLVKTQKDLAHQQAEAKVKAAEMTLLNKVKEQQLEKQKLLRNGMSIGTGLLILVGLLTFRSMQLRKRLEKQQAITQERKRISADLHDDIGSGLTKISLWSELVKKQAQTPQAKTEAGKIVETVEELSDNMSEIIWALNSNNDFMENLVAYIRRYAGEYFENSPVRLKISVPQNIPHIPVSGEHRRNIFYVVKEALHNIVKHAEATEAEIKFTTDNNRLSVMIKDNGKGIPHGELNRFGNGINNMRSRMKNINGEFSIENHDGTKVILSLPV